MIDHRRVQRTLFRMQHDPSFAHRLRARDAETVRSTRLSDEDLSLLLSASAGSITADASGKRRAQFLRNVSSEHALTVAHAGSGPDPGLLESFPSSPWFHDAVRDDLRLPLAFGAHARERAGRCGDALLQALAEMETAMARARRQPFARSRPPSGGISLSPRAEVLVLPEGSIEAASTLRLSLDAGRAAPLDLRVHHHRREHALVLSGERPPHRLGEARIELLSPLAGELLLLAREAPAADRLAAFCAAHDASPEELEAFVASLAEDGVVLRA